MLIRQFGALLATATAAQAYRDASPFFILSTGAIKPDSSLHTAQLSTASHVEEGLTSALSDCAASLYVFVDQPGAHASDLRDGTAMPHMSRRIASSEYKSIVQVPEVLGEVDVWSVANELSRKCNIEKMSTEAYLSSGLKGKAAILQPTLLPTLAADAAQSLRMETLRASDETLDAELHSVLANHTSHVIIFVSTPADVSREHYEYDEPPYPAGMHTDLKRDIGELSVHANKKNETWGQENLPLFEKYQFLTPGIFMGLFVSILLLSILYVGLYAIAGLEVSYGAFSKENGPQAQKKLQ
ncbi:unnamed protein product [Zymoseptoria tritici ST99CH_1A5]|uniref:Protein BIG1 n=3 Tax=Zymoseptoria tritici TaxID=1047171 RepID=F9XFN7_ZYMTI|nr:uncharacterized protein MYCGRDRAFT_105180 [Zymoseptoria tritici IPO323]EGP85659.1 hypothetical protein MYCGRDRAFT_105180 [Zymoseptoria tritici IPO323]SMR55260.1 unnamed protein product [Zymoseptoria tritici ST99CH_1E4]SMR57634.1 unnamed protein product [Zymoseptoria tritici ST99CH_3D1]SMY26072.1 unnamed protein product [Zymoseptoria tritici ST99CH_1A5]